jgi:hypothetical protein
MEKIVYLCWKRPELPIEAFREHWLGHTADAVLSGGARALTLNIADLGPRIAGCPLVLGEGAQWSACVSLWLDSLDARAAIEAALSAQCERVAGYLVTESVPQRWAGRDWADRTRSPGVTLVTAFPKPERLSDEQFYGHWHGSHTPLSFQIHPFRQYIRNAVARSLTPMAAPYRGIVEERVAELEDALDMRRFFRGSTANMQRGMADVDSFLDRAQIAATLMSEYIIAA